MKKVVLSVLALSALIMPNVNASEIAIKQDNGDIFLSGLSSYQTIIAEYQGVPKVSKKSANECGFIRLTSTTSTPLNTSSDSITFNNTTYDLATVPVGETLRCTDGQLVGTIAGTVQKDGNAVYITGLTPYSSHDIGYNNLPVSRSAKANACGIVRLSNSDRYDNSAGAIAIKDRQTGASIGTLPTFSSLPQTGGPLCRQGIGFYPTNYPTTSNF